MDALADYWLEPEIFAPWRRRVVAEQLSRHLTVGRRAALLALINACPTSNYRPTDKEVSALCGMSDRTVRRARVDAKALKLLSWERERQFVNGRWVQGKNVYTLHLPESPVCCGVRSDGQIVRASKQVKKERPEGTPEKGPTRSIGQVLQAFGLDPKDTAKIRTDLAALTAQRMAGIMDGLRRRGQQGHQGEQR